MSEEQFDEQLFWKINDDEKEGHIKEDKAKKDEFKKVSTDELSCQISTWTSTDLGLATDDQVCPGTV